jgi:putative transposase
MQKVQKWTSVSGTMKGLNHSEELIPESGTVRFSDAAWAEARRRAEVIRPIAVQETVASTVAAEAALKLGVTDRTVYEFIKRWRESDGSLLALLPMTSSGGKGQTRLLPEVEQLMSSVISTMYLSKQRVSVASLMKSIRAECRKAGLDAPAKVFIHGSRLPSGSWIDSPAA